MTTKQGNLWFIRPIPCDCYDGCDKCDDLPNEILIIAANKEIALIAAAEAYKVDPARIAHVYENSAKVLIAEGLCVV